MKHNEGPATQHFLAYCFLFAAEIGDSACVGEKACVKEGGVIQPDGIKFEDGSCNFELACGNSKGNIGPNAW